MLSLVTPGFGLTIWMLITFAILMFLLKKMAWKPILNALSTRESKIEEALLAASNAKKEVENFNKQKDEMKKEALAERDHLMSEARALKEDIISKAKQAAGKEAEKMLEDAKTSIEQEKKNALNELKQEVSSIALDIAEKVVEYQLSSEKTQKELVEALIKETK